MRLTELSPRWWGEPGRAGQFLIFLCPHCRKVRLGIAIANPIDGGPAHPNTVDDMLHHIHELELYEVGSRHGVAWTRTGETFEELSLSPSVNAEPSGHWHGFITNGEAR